MSETNAIVKRDESESIHALAMAFVKSGYFADLRNPEQAIVKMLAGRELGLQPFASIRGIHIIQGVPTVGANLLASAVRSSGRYTYKVIELTDTVCNLEFYEILPGGKRELLGASRFSMEDAKKAGTKNLDRFPRNMLFARAISNGVRWYCPDVTGGAAMCTPEEMGAETGEDGQVISGEFTATTTGQPPAPIVQPAPQMTLEDAMAMKSPKGVAFGDATIENLRTVAAKATGAPQQAAQIILENADLAVLDALTTKAHAAGLTQNTYAAGPTTPANQVIGWINELSAMIADAEQPTAF